MKAIITGATGFLGSHLVTELKQKGWNILATGRNTFKGQQLRCAQTRFKAIDLTQKEAVISQFEQADVLFHCAALSHDWGSAAAFYQANVAASRHVLAACRHHHIKRCIYVSSTSVYFDFTDKLNIKEADVLTQGFANEYAKSKYLGEQVMLNEQGPTDVVIIRPRGIIGEGDTSILPRILTLINKGYFPLINQGRAKVDITYVKNVTHALYLAAITPDLNKACFNISNDQPMTVKSLLALLQPHINIQPRFIPVPYNALILCAYILEKRAACQQHRSPALTRYGAGLLSKSQTLNITAAKQRLGYQPRYSLEHGIEQFFKEKKSC